MTVYTVIYFCEKYIPSYTRYMTSYDRAWYMTVYDVI